MTATVLLLLAVLFASSYATSIMAANSRSLHWTNSALGTASILRASLSQANLFARDVDLGVSEAATLDLAIDEALRTRTSFVEVGNGVESALGENDPGFEEQFNELARISIEILELGDSGEWQSALLLFSDSFEPDYQLLRDRATEAQAEIIERINATEELAGLVSGTIRFVIILLLPAIALFIYRRIVRRQMREQKRDLRLQLEAERKVNKAKDDLIAGVSHQLRTPLTSIYGMSDVLVDGRGIDLATARELMGLIHNEAYELDRMVADLLAFARLDTELAGFKKEPIDVAKVVERAVFPAQRTGHEVTVVLEENLVAIADADRVVHLLRSLLSNARQHGGPETTVRSSRIMDRILIAVEDDGDEVLDPDDIFSGFASEGRDAVVSGSVGLGLAVARSMVQHMGGDLAYNRISDTNIFTFDLPAAPEIEDDVEAYGDLVDQGKGAR
ncbi:MAG: histidine kinase dimerization/phospho-acceptor domain-containing protein [Acidimicrobiia bacterium]